MVGHDLLTDDDDSNDVGGFWQLGRALLHAGHDADATRAFLLIRQHLNLMAERQRNLRKAAYESTLAEPAPESSEAAAPNEMAVREKIAVDDDSANATHDFDETDNNESPEKAEALTTDVDSQEINDEDPPYWFCNGRCGNRKLAYGPDHSICRYCLEVDFCDGCLQLLKSGNLGFRVCSPEHDFFKLEQPKEELEKGKVRVGDKIIHFSEWVRLLKEEWS
jgi:hypothetical protein